MSNILKLCLKVRNTISINIYMGVFVFSTKVAYGMYMTAKISDHRLTFELCSRSNILKKCHKTRNANSFIFYEG